MASTLYNSFFARRKSVLATRKIALVLWLLLAFSLVCSCGRRLCWCWAFGMSLSSPNNTAQASEFRASRESCFYPRLLSPVPQLRHLILRKHPPTLSLRRTQSMNECCPAFVIYSNTLWHPASYKARRRICKQIGRPHSWSGSWLGLSFDFTGFLASVIGLFCNLMSARHACVADSHWLRSILKLVPQISLRILARPRCSGISNAMALEVCLREILVDEIACPSPPSRRFSWTG